jgi:hypothetical protein
MGHIRYAWVGRCANVMYVVPYRGGSEGGIIDILTGEDIEVGTCETVYWTC